MNNHDEMLLLSDIYIWQWNNDQAVKLLNDILIENPNYVRAYNHLWRIYDSKLSNYEKAKKYYQTWLSIDPYYASLHINYCYLLLDYNEYDDLEKALNNAFQTPWITTATLYYIYACMYEKQYQYNQAIIKFEKAILESLNNDKIRDYEECISRCNKKQSIVSWKKESDQS